MTCNVGVTLDQYKPILNSSYHFLCRFPAQIKKKMLLVSKIWHNSRAFWYSKFLLWKEVLSLQWLWGNIVRYGSVESMLRMKIFGCSFKLKKVIHPTWGVDICLRSFCVCAVLCSWSPVQGVLQTLYKIHNFRNNSEWVQAREPNPSRRKRRRGLFSWYCLFFSWSKTYAVKMYQRYILRSLVPSIEMRMNRELAYTT
jgi:hypothetical protein